MPSASSTAAAKANRPATAAGSHQWDRRAPRGRLRGWRGVFDKATPPVAQPISRRARAEPASCPHPARDPRSWVTMGRSGAARQFDSRIPGFCPYPEGDWRREASGGWERRPPPTSAVCSGRGHLPDRRRGDDPASRARPIRSGRSSRCPLWLVVAKLEGLYDNDHPKIWHLTTDEAPAIFHWVTLSVAGTLLFIRALPDETITLEAAAALYFTALGSAFALRAAPAGSGVDACRPSARWCVGSGQLADAVARKLALEPGHHLTVKESRPDGRIRHRLAGNGAERSDIGRRSRSRPEPGRHSLAARRGTHRALDSRRAGARRGDARARSSPPAGWRASSSASLPPMRAMFGTAVQLSHVAEMPVIEYRT